MLSLIVRGRQVSRVQWLEQEAGEGDRGEWTRETRHSFAHLPRVRSLETPCLRKTRSALFHSYTRYSKSHRPEPLRKAASSSYNMFPKQVVWWWYQWRETETETTFNFVQNSYFSRTQVVLWWYGPSDQFPAMTFLLSGRQKCRTWFSELLVLNKFVVTARLESLPKTQSWADATEKPTCWNRSTVSGIFLFPQHIVGYVGKLKCSWFLQYNNLQHSKNNGISLSRTTVLCLVLYEYLCVKTTVLTINIVNYNEPNDVFLVLYRIGPRIRKCPIRT